MNVEKFQLIANGLVLASSSILVAVPQFYYSVFFGRLIAGVGCGFGYVAVTNLILAF